MQKKRLLLPGIATSLALSMSFCAWKVHSQADTGQQSNTNRLTTAESATSARIDLTSYPQLKYDAQVVRITSKTQLVTTKADFSGQSTIDFWNIKTGKIEDTLVPPEPTSSRSVRVSQDLTLMVAFQDVASYLASPVYDPHKLFIWKLPTKRLVQTIDIGTQFHLDSVVFAPGDANRLIATATDTSGHNDRVLYINRTTSRVDKVVPYAYAGYLGQDHIQFSPDGKLVAALYPMAEGYAGSIHILDAHSSKVVSKYDGDFVNHPVDEPFFFLSPTQIVCNRFIFNFKTQHLASLFHPNDARLRCVAGLPGELGCAFFLSKAGLELWNLPSNKFIKRWPQVRKAETLYFSPDRTVIGVYANQTIQFLPFDPHILVRKAEK